MAELTVQNIVVTGLEATFASAAGGGDTFRNDGKTLLEVVNGSGADITVTITTPATAGGIAIDNPAIVVTAGERRHIGPFEPALFNNSSGLVAITYSGVTSLTIAALRLP